MTTPSALHSAKTPKWGTPSRIIASAWALLGKIDVDPASSFDFNKFVGASQIYTEQDNGLTKSWLGKVFVNPPGGLVVEFWEKLIQEVLSGNTGKAFWIGFSVEQLCLLSLHEFGPLDFSTVILRKRLSFTSEQGQTGGSPSHGNYLTALGCDRELFDKLFSSLGKVVHGRCV